MPEAAAVINGGWRALRVQNLGVGRGAWSGLGEKWGFGRRIAVELHRRETMERARARVRVRVLGKRKKIWRRKVLETLSVADSLLLLFARFLSILDWSKTVRFRDLSEHAFSVIIYISVERLTRGIRIL